MKGWQNLNFFNFASKGGIYRELGKQTMSISITVFCLHPSYFFHSVPDHDNLINFSYLLPLTHTFILFDFLLGEEHFEKVQADLESCSHGCS